MSKCSLGCKEGHMKKSFVCLFTFKVKRTSALVTPIDDK